MLLLDTHRLMRRPMCRLCVKRGAGQESKCREKNGYEEQMVRFIHLDNNKGIILRRRDRLRQGIHGGIGSDNGLECCHWGGGDLVALFIKELLLVSRVEAWISIYLAKSLGLALLFGLWKD
jgi:hypothetical protein